MSRQSVGGETPSPSRSMARRERRDGDGDDEVLEVPVAEGVVPADPPRPAALVDARVRGVGGEERLLGVLEAQHDLGAVGHGPERQRLAALAVGADGLDHRRRHREVEHVERRLGLHEQRHRAVPVERDRRHRVRRGACRERARQYEKCRRYPTAHCCLPFTANTCLHRASLPHPRAEGQCLDSPAPWPAYLQEIPRRPTARCPRRRSRGSGRGRSASTCTCRSARPAAATATSTPTSRTRRRATATCAAVMAELDLAAPVLGTGRRASTRSSSAAVRRRCCTPHELGQIVPRSTSASGLPTGAEVTTEANPERCRRRELARAARRRVHAPLARDAERGAARARDARPRAHARARPRPRPREARAAGFEHVSLDLIYGTPGETDDDWRAVAGRRAGGGARPRQRVRADRRARNARWPRGSRRGELPAPDDDAMARRYELADERARRPGCAWYELCSWARDDAARCRHNLGYWRGDDWWGDRPGRAQPRRRRALVERPAPARLDRRARQGGSPRRPGREVPGRRRGAASSA